MAAYDVARLKSLPSLANTSRLAPITGRFRKRLILDISVSLGLGVAAGYAWWYGWHVRKIEIRDNYYLELERQKAEEA